MNRVPVIAAVAAAGAVAAVAGAFVAWRPRRVVVHGVSMEPALAEGDRLLVVRGRRIAPGDVVALRDPRRPSRLLVKRVTAVAANEVVVHGDNPPASTDSRSFGPVPRRAVVGRVVRRYGRGPVRSPG